MLSVPGRVNLIGEHIDYHSLPVLPMAIQKRIAIAFQMRKDKQVRALSRQASGVAKFGLDGDFTSGAPGDWGNYVRAAASALQIRYRLVHGIDAVIASDLPLAAGLSSSSALLIAFSLALLRANSVEVSLHELATVLPDAEQFVGTRGGAMDHVAILASRAGFATLIKSFSPPEIEYVPVPPNWRFLVAHSLVNAEKSGAVRAEFNERRAAGSRALQRLGFSSYPEALASADEPRLTTLTEDPERDAFLHVTTEALRVQQAVAMLRDGDLSGFGKVLNESHASLRDRLRVSVTAVDQLCEAALRAGAYGARMTGAGFGGCVVVLCTNENVEQVGGGLVQSYYAERFDFDGEKHLFVAEPSAGAIAQRR